MNLIVDVHPVSRDAPMLAVDANRETKHVDHTRTKHTCLHTSEGGIGHLVEPNAEEQIL